MWADRRTDGQTDMIKLEDAFPGFVNSIKIILFKKLRQWNTVKFNIALKKDD